MQTGIGPALLDTFHLGGWAKALRTAKGWIGPPLRITFASPARDNRAVATSLELTQSDGRLVCRARVADSFAARFRGLMGAADLPRGEGLLLPRTRSVHTHFMRFPIDVVFLDEERRVVAVARSLRPWGMAGAKGAKSVLELAAGECERLGLAEGDVLVER